MATTNPAALFPLSQGTGRILPCPRRCPLAPCLILTSAAPTEWGRKAGAVPQSHQSSPSPTAWPWIPPGGHLSPYRTKTCTPPRAAPSKTSLLVPAPLGPTALPQSARTPPVPPHSPWCRKGLPAALWGGSAALNLLLPPLSLPPNLSFRPGLNQNLGGKGRRAAPGWGSTEQLLQPHPPFIHPAPFHPRPLLAPQPQLTPTRVPHEAPEELQAHHEKCQRGKGQAWPPSPSPKRDPRCNHCALRGTHQCRDASPPCPGGLCPAGKVAVPGAAASHGIFLPAAGGQQQAQGATEAPCSRQSPRGRGWKTGLSAEPLAGAGGHEQGASGRRRGEPPPPAPGGLSGDPLETGDPPGGG